MIYVMVFFLSVIFAALAEKYKNKWLVCLFSGISILIPSILGGIRDTSLGTDVRVYLISHFNFARETISLKTFLTTYNTMTGKEPIYRIIVYWTAKIADNVNFLLFVLQFLTILFVYIGAYKHRKETKFPLVMLMFFLLYYNDTYNLVRQYLAMAIIFANIDKLEKKKYGAFFVYIVIAGLVHSSAILSIGLIIVHYLVTSGRLEYKLTKKIMLITGVSIGCLFFSQIIAIAVKIGVVSERYLYYIQNKGISGNNLASLVYLSELLVCLLYSKKIKSTLKQADFYLINAVLLLILLQLSRTIYYGNRISMLFMFPNLLLIGAIPKMVKNSKNRNLCSLLIVMIGIIYWTYIYVHGNVSQTYPYIFGI